jgi:hypothetical protein
MVHHLVTSLAEVPAVLKVLVGQEVVVMDQETPTVEQEEQILVAVAAVLTVVQATQVVQAVQVL